MCLDRGAFFAARAVFGLFLLWCCLCFTSKILQGVAYVFGAFWAYCDGDSVRVCVVCELGVVAVEQCGACGTATSALLLEWNADTGWRYVCDAHRLVPTVTGPGQWQFVRVGD